MYRKNEEKRKNEEEKRKNIKEHTPAC